MKSTVAALGAMSVAALLLLQACVARYDDFGASGAADAQNAEHRAGDADVETGYHDGRSPADMEDSAGADERHGDVSDGGDGTVTDTEHVDAEAEGVPDAETIEDADAGDAAEVVSVPVCGDGSCDGGESCSTCGSDCPCAPSLKCSNGECKECDDENLENWDGCNDGKIVEFRINTKTAGTQRAPSVAGTADGHFLIAWDSNGEGTEGYDILARSFQPGGASFGGAEYKVNSTVAGSQANSAALSISDSRIVIVWESGPDVDTDVFGTVRQVDNQQNEGEFQVNSLQNAPPFAGNPALAPLPDQKFCVVWNTDDENDHNKAEVYWRRYDSVPNPLAPEIHVNTYVTGLQSRPVATPCNKDTLVLWDSVGKDGSGAAIVGAVVDSSGALWGSEFVINTFKSGDQTAPSVAALPECGSFVAWRSMQEDGDMAAVAAQRLDGTGAADGPQMTVNDYSEGAQDGASVAALESGTVMVVWQSCPPGGKTGQDGDGCGIYARMFASNGGELKSEFRVNELTKSSQSAPAVAAAGNRFVVVWQGESDDGSWQDIYARLFDPTGEPVCSSGSCIGQVP